MDDRIKTVSDGLSGHLYKRYLCEILERLEQEPLPDDWLFLSSSTLARIIGDSTNTSGQGWWVPMTWLEYADKRYDRIKDRLNGLLRPSAMAGRSSPGRSGDGTRFHFGIYAGWICGGSGVKRTIGPGCALR